MDIPNAQQFHIQPGWVVDQAVCIPVGALYRQMTKVLRLKTGSAVRLFDGQGNAYEGTIAHSNKDGIIVPIAQRTIQPRGPEIHLAMAIIKNDRMRWVLEKATELGVHSIIPIISERVIKRPVVAPPRWSHIVREAAEQCGRAWLPQITPVQKYADALSAAQHPVVYDVTALPESTVPHVRPLTLFIGPEGGFTPDELRLAKREDATIASLGAHQLRADTAATVALARI